MFGTSTFQIARGSDRPSMRAASIRVKSNSVRLASTERATNGMVITTCAISRLARRP